MVTEEKFAHRSLKARERLHSVRAQILMDEVHRAEIGERIRELREASPYGNRTLADEIGVSERAVAKWVQGKGISYKNAKKVAALFKVDVDWLWRGEKQTETPDVMAALDGDELTTLRAMVSELLDRVRQGSEQEKGAQDLLGEVRGMAVEGLELAHQAVGDQVAFREQVTDLRAQCVELTAAVESLRNQTASLRSRLEHGEQRAEDSNS